MMYYDSILLKCALITPNALIVRLMQNPGKTCIFNPDEIWLALPHFSFGIFVVSL